MNYNIQSYDFGAASFNMLGRFVQGISGVTIDTTQEASWRYGANNKPMSVARGQKANEGTITLHGFEFVTLVKALPPGSDIFDLPLFDMNISFGNDPSAISSRTVKYQGYRPEQRAAKQRPDRRSGTDLHRVGYGNPVAVLRSFENHSSNLTWQPKRR